jgi:DNA-binding response OmpR family regulator
MVITDVEMPHMSGYELCSSIKSHAGLRGLPVMLLTSLSDATDVVRGWSAAPITSWSSRMTTPFLLSRIVYALEQCENAIQRASSTCETSDGAGEGVEVFLAGQRHVLSAAPDLNTTLDLLLGTYEAAIGKNRELSRAREALEKQAGELASANEILERTTQELQEKNEHMQADLNLAREIQNGFILKQYPSFPHGVVPDRSALRFTQRWIPTTTLGGDFFDVLALSNTQAWRLYLRRDGARRALGAGDGDAARPGRRAHLAGAGSGPVPGRDQPAPDRDPAADPHTDVRQRLLPHRRRGKRAPELR